MMRIGWIEISDVSNWAAGFHEIVDSSGTVQKTQNHLTSFRGWGRNTEFWAEVLLGRTIAVVRMALEDRAIWIGVFAGLHVWSGDSVDESNGYGSFRFAGVNVQRFVQLAAIGRQFEGAAHVAAKRTFFIRYELGAAPVR
jgi:hypothetical protein